MGKPTKSPCHYDGKKIGTQMHLEPMTRGKRRAYLAKLRTEKRRLKTIRDRGHIYTVGLVNIPRDMQPRLKGT